MGLFDYLKAATVEEAALPKKGTSGVQKQRNPAPGIIAIRVFSDGSVYPSEAAVAKFDLEYKDATVKVETLPLKDGEVEAKAKKSYEYLNGAGNGLDLLDSRHWGQYKGEGKMLFVAVTPKTEPKIDMFGSVNYDETGKPKVTVMEQGANTFGKATLLESIEAVYGIKFAVAERKKDGIVLQPAVEGISFVDMVIFEGVEGLNITEKFSTPILLAPKVVIRGEDKGKPDYARRENVKVYGFAPYALIFGEVPEERSETEAESLGIAEPTEVNEPDLTAAE